MDPDWNEFLAGGAGSSGRCARTWPHSPNGACASAYFAGSSRPRRSDRARARGRLACRRRAGGVPADGASGRGGGSCPRRSGGRFGLLPLDLRHGEPRRYRRRSAGHTRFLQVYVFRDHGITAELIADAIEAGFSAVFLTVDLPMPGPRDRERRIHWTFDDSSLPAVGRALARPRQGRPSTCSTRRWTGPLPRPTCGVGLRTRRRQGNPRPRGCHPGRRNGAAGIVVSNHGGRQLDGAMPLLEALPAIVDAVGDRLEVLFDGGIRRGTDVATALALGARAVLAGRMPLLGPRGPRGGGPA